MRGTCLLRVAATSFIRNLGGARGNRSVTRNTDPAHRNRSRRLYRMSKPVIILSLSLMLLISSAAIADDPVTIRIYNDGADDIVVSVYDMNALPPQAVIFNQRINGFAWIPITVTAGTVGNGDVNWIARTADRSFHQCGYQEMHGVANDSFVYISADSGCREITR